ncbi:hypothetical protein Trydic_g21803 [Trypoxylus dichotomus]
MSLNYGYVAEDIVKEERVSRSEIEIIREWNRNANLPILIDEQIVGFLLSCERDVEFTKKTIVEYFKVRKHGKELFSNRDVQLPELQLQLATLEYIAFPEKTDDGCLIVYHKLHDPTYWKYNMADSMRLLFMTLDAALHQYPPTGLIILFDMKGVSLMHLTRVRMGCVKIFFEYCQEALPVKLKTIHILNCVYFLDKVIAIAKPFMKKELFEKVHFHPPSLDMEKFYKTCIDKKYLPSDYGGDLPNTRILHEMNTKKLADLKSFFDAEEEFRNLFNEC